jgi:hypothetical protein
MARIQGVSRDQAGPVVRLVYRFMRRDSGFFDLDRFNAAFGIGPAGYSEGMVCVPPAPARREGSPGRGVFLGREENARGPARPAKNVSERPPVGRP